MSYNIVCQHILFTLQKCKVKSAESVTDSFSRTYDDKKSTPGHRKIFQITEIISYDTQMCLFLFI